MVDNGGCSICWKNSFTGASIALGTENNKSIKISNSLSGQCFAGRIHHPFHRYGVRIIRQSLDCGKNGCMEKWSRDNQNSFAKLVPT